MYAVIMKQPPVIPAPPAPVIARPTMRVVLSFATPMYESMGPERRRRI